MNIFRDAIPDAQPSDIVAWAESNVKVDGHSFDRTRTPQLIEPLRAMADADTRIGTLVKPVQIGGSTAGEVVAAWWCRYGRGKIQYNWQDDKKAVERWKDRIQPCLDSVADLRWAGGRFDETLCEARFLNATLITQGVFVESSLDSETIPLQINEEVHLWKPGFLSKARRRQTQVWNAKAFDISNASNEDDQLHAAYDDGTAEVWENKCPHCSGWHQFIFRFDPNKPNLGGLRWDSDGARMEGGRYNYNLLEKTIYYQFPCGGTIRDLAVERRALEGRYRKTNEGAHVTHRSWNFEATSCPSIRWLALVKEWHSAIRALKCGDPEPMRRFRTERECKFWGDDGRPFVQRVTLSRAKKNRDGLKNRAFRFAAIDRQQGTLSKGEFPHWWLVIRDVAAVDGKIHSLLVYEGKVLTDEDLVAVLREHDVVGKFVVVDSGDDTPHVYRFCLQHGFNAIKGHHNIFFSHDDGGRKVFSPLKPLHLMVNAPPTQANPTDEPDFWFYSKSGIRARLDWLRSGCGGMVLWETPSDVSEDYKQHQESEDLEERRTASGEIVREYVQRRRRNDLYVCECYIAMLIEMSGVLSSILEEPKQ